MRQCRVKCLAIRGFVLAALAALTACGHPFGRHSARDCLARAMYFESIRSSDDGMLAVGTVVMNRVESGKYPRNVCAVVGQKKQFAPGVLSKRMQEGRSRDRAYRNADAVLRGKRHPGVGNAMFFHTAGYNYPYKNMNYKVIAGGNAFYERRTPGFGQGNTTQIEVAQAARQPRPGSYITEIAAAPQQDYRNPGYAAAEPIYVEVASAGPVARTPHPAPIYVAQAEPAPIYVPAADPAPFYAAEAPPPGEFVGAPVMLVPPEEDSIGRLIALSGG